MTKPPPFKWHLARSPSRTYCNQVLRTRTAHFNPNFFQAEPEQRRCTQCDKAYEALQTRIRAED